MLACMHARIHRTGKHTYTYGDRPLCAGLYMSLTMSLAVYAKEKALENDQVAGVINESMAAQVRTPAHTHTNAYHMYI